MKYRNCVYTMVAALLVACSLAVSGCSDKKTEEPAPPAVSYGRREEIQSRLGFVFFLPSEIQYIFPPRD